MPSPKSRWRSRSGHAPIHCSRRVVCSMSGNEGGGVREGGRNEGVKDRSRDRENVASRAFQPPHDQDRPPTAAEPSWRPSKSRPARTLASRIGQPAGANGTRARSQAMLGPAALVSVLSVFFVLARMRGEHCPRTPTRNVAISQPRAGLKASRRVGVSGNENSPFRRS